MNTKTLLRINIARLLFKSRITTPARLDRGRLSIVTFHRVLQDPERQVYPFPDLAVTPKELDAFLSYFKEHFDCGSLACQHERFLNEKSPDRPLLAITFDDAQHDNFCNARPMLEKYNIKASFFVPVAAVEHQEPLWHDRLGFAILNILKHGRNEQERMMKLLASVGISVTNTHNLVSNIVEASKRLTKEVRLLMIDDLIESCGIEQVPEFARLMTFAEISELATDGHEIGSHSMTHCMMPECDDITLTYEVVESRKILQALTGKAVESFCYPNGNSDARSARAVDQAGYIRAVTTTWGNNGKNANCFQLNRYDMVSKRVMDSSGNFCPALLAFRMSGYYPGMG